MDFGFFRIGRWFISIGCLEIRWNEEKPENTQTERVPEDRLWSFEPYLRERPSA